jgi:hypothetical protein
MQSCIAAARTRCARLSQNSSAPRLDETLISRPVVGLTLSRGLQCYSDSARSDSIRVVFATIVGASVFSSNSPFSGSSKAGMSRASCRRWRKLPRRTTASGCRQGQSRWQASPLPVPTASSSGRRAQRCGAERLGAVAPRPRGFPDTERAAFVSLSGPRPSPSGGFPCSLFAPVLMARPQP